jgi:alpha-glucoside transport system substrate-binding protein
VFVGGALPAWAEAQAMDISEYVDIETLQSDFGHYLLHAGTLKSEGGGALPPDGRVLAIPLDVDLKGLVFYPREAFREAGYPVPNSWAELIALSHQIADDGRTPWCFAFQSGPGTGWPGTDFIESLVMRSGGIDTYDAWTTGEVGFMTEDVLKAGRLADELIFEPGFVEGGPASISEEWYESPLSSLISLDEETNQRGEPKCWMFHQGDFMLEFVPPDIDFFMLPAIVPDQPTPAIGSATFASALVDTPEVRAFMEFIASPEWGERWARDSLWGFTSANQRFDRFAYGDPNLDPTVEVRSRVASVVQTALASGLFRFDASDQMPIEIGLVTEDDDGEAVPGAFYQGMLDWVDGVRSIDQVFADIDAEWAALRAERATGAPDP